MARSVTPIPATKNKFSSAVITSNNKKRVAGYARVSTDMDEQFTSFEAQMNYYTSFIKGHKDWDFVDVYSDEGISGTNTLHRAGFQQMIEDALSGKIDLIITKSVSRFARNTVDTLTTIRELKDKGVEVFFEKENIWTFDSKGELLITIMASLAQEESRSLSENIKWAVNKKFEQGKFSLPYKAFLGYDKGADGLPTVNPDEAETVREIYHRFLAGESPLSISHVLESKGIEAPRGGKKWCVSTITSILKNEKYAGNAVLQKSFTVDFLTKKKQKNNGEVPKYYVKDSHEAIITEEEYELVQQELKDRITCCHQTYSASIYSDRIFCGECGKPYGSKVWHSNDKYRRVIFRCNSKYSKDKKPCSTPHLTEDEIKEVFLKALNKLLTNKETVVQNLELLKNRLFATAELEQELSNLDAEIEVTKELYRKGISAGPITDSSRLSSLQNRYSEILQKRNETKDEITSRKNKRLGINRFIRTLKDADEQVSEFSDELFVGLLDHMTVYSKTCIAVTFKGGQEIRIEK